MKIFRVAAPICLLLSACSGLPTNLLPFGGDKVVDRSRAPADATEYQCNAGKRFYVRTLDGGSAVWLILPDREIRLAKSTEGGRYANGSNVLDVSGSEASFRDGTNNAYTSCKTKTAN